MARLASSIRSLLERPDAERRLGPFLLVEQLGRGGFAPVWLAKEIYGATELRTAAVKLFSLDAGGGGTKPSGGSDAPPSGFRTPPSAAVRARIVEEARSLCQVEHPNVVRFYSLPIDEARGVMGLAMEYVAGVALDKRIVSRGRLSVSETLAVGIAVASALSAVHRAGLVHRDVKPGNVIDAAGVYKLIDFGIAAADAVPPKPLAKPRIVTFDDLPLEVVGTKMSNLEGAVTVEGGSESPTSLDFGSGTVGYIDPECISRGSAATFASDLYALGATLFECLTGLVPAAADAPEGRGLKGEVIDGRSPSPKISGIAKGVPPALARLVDSLLAPEREGRPISAELVAIRLEQIKNELAGQRRSLPPESVGPFRGLGRFEQGDRDVYFGRASEVAAALEMLRSRGVVALIGPSGSGKSSLARAGVLPAVAEGALGGWPKRWATLVVEPGLDPRATLSAALAPFVPGAATLAPEAVVVALGEHVQAAGEGVLLLVDQLEELATVASGPSQAWTVHLLARLGEQAIPGVRTVVAARRDLLDPLLSLGELGKVLVRGLVLIEPITELTWGDVLEQALAAYGYAFEDDALKHELLGQLKSTAGAMPLVQFALTELWNKRDPARRMVTRAGLVAIGGIAGALERHASSTLAEISRRRPEAQFAAKSVLLALTTPQGTRATRKMEDLRRAGGGLGGDVIESLERARLIVPGPQGVTLAHEALLSQWGKLRAWVAEAREDRLLADELERDAARWKDDPDETQLWQRRRLAFGEDLRRRGIVEMSPDAVEFLKRSRRAEQLVRLRIGAIIGVILSAFIGSGAFYAKKIHERGEEAQSLYRNERKAREETERANANLAQSNADLEDKNKIIKENTAQLKQLMAELGALKMRGADTDKMQQRAAALAHNMHDIEAGGAASSRPPGALPAAAGSAVATPAASSAPAPGIKPQTTWD